MADNSYAVEVKPASKNGWQTPDEARRYYGRYSRDYYIVHWWGAPGQTGNHNQIVNYILGTAAKGQMSVNYVLSNAAITMLVYLMNVSWGSQSGNPVGINVEHEPTLGDEGYKKSGWLKEQCEQVLGKRLGIKGHRDFIATQCPGTISYDRIEQECDKWRRKVYDQPSVPAPQPIPTPPPAPKLVVIDDTDRVLYTLANAKLVNMDNQSVVKTFPIDTPMEVSQKVRYNNMEFYRTVSATNQNRLQGFLVGDLKETVGNPTPPGTPPPAPVPEVPVPEWVANLRDIDDTEFWLTKDQELIDITASKPAEGKSAKTFKKDDSFVASALTVVGKTEYRITDYSFKKGIFNGVPTSSLTLTKPGVPNIPPIPHTDPDSNAVKAFLTMLRDLITQFLGKFK